VTLGDYYRRAGIPKPEPRCVTKTRKAKVDAKDEREARAAVKARDKGRCRIPGCSEHAVHLHHVIYRSHSKRLRWRTGNLLSLCLAHHQLEHAGEIQITGDADEEIVVTGNVDKLRFRL
jgi:5-methylcytosine-specific restriction endonuclease McrA